MNKNNICILTRTLLVGGAEKQALLLAYCLKNNYKVYLVVLYGEKIDSKYMEYINDKGINTVYLKGRMLHKLYIFINFLKSHQIHYIFTYLPSTNIIGTIAGKITGVRFIFGGVRASEFPKYKFLIQKFLHNYLLKYTIFNSNFGAKKFISKGFKSKKVLVLHNGIEINKEVCRSDNNNEIRILSVGRFHFTKDYLTALKAINHLLKSISEQSYVIKYWLIGYGELEDNIRKWIKEYKLEEHVKLIINPSNIDNYYSNADIYLCTSIFEGLSNSIMEAMNFSLPIIATNNVGDDSYLVEDGFNGYLCDIRDYKTMAERLKILIINKINRNQIGLNSFEKLKNNFSLEIFRDRYIHLIKNCGKKKLIL